MTNETKILDDIWCQLMANQAELLQMWGPLNFGRWYHKDIDAGDGGITHGNVSFEIWNQNYHSPEAVLSYQPYTIHAEFNARDYSRCDANIEVRIWIDYGPEDYDPKTLATRQFSNIEEAIVFAITQTEFERLKTEEWIKSKK